MPVQARNDIHQGFCTRLTKLRKNGGYSRYKLSILLGVSERAVLQWEYGQRIPNTIHLDNMAKFFGVSMDYMWRGYDREHCT